MKAIRSLVWILHVKAKTEVSRSVQTLVAHVFASRVSHDGLWGKRCSLEKCCFYCYLHGHPTGNIEVIISISWWRKGWTNQLWFQSATWYYWVYSLQVSHTGDRVSSWATDPLPTCPWVCSGCCARDISSSRLYLLILSPPCLTSCMCEAKASKD